MDYNDTAVVMAGMACRRRRRWADVEIAEMVAESFEPGQTALGVARRYGVSFDQLQYWRRQERSTGSNGEMAFVPVLIEDAPRCGVVPDPASLEIVIGDVCIRFRGGVDTAALQAVLRAVRLP
jgi:transposase-like protein